MLRLTVTVASLFMLLAFPSGALADHNDDFAVADAGDADLILNETDVGTNAGFTTESGEPLPCEIGATAWYAVTAEVDGDMVVTTADSDFDTVLAVYGPDDGVNAPFIDCSDDDATLNDGTSLVVFTAEAGERYFVQAGGFRGEQGELQVTAFGDTAGGGGTPPDNDGRAAAEAVALEETTLHSNDSATTAGEPLDCNGSSYDSTVWFRFTVPAPGDVVVNVTSTSMDPVVGLYSPGSNAQIACNDDAPGQSLSSRVAARLGPGEYFVQVGGVPGQLETGLFNLQVTFARDNDLDDDGSVAGQDCDDGNPGIKPGAPEVVNNDVDENCDNVKEFDRDGDGSRVPGNPADCDDNNPARSPLKPEVVGNKVDENCDGAARAYDVIVSRVSAIWDLGKVTKMLDLVIYNSRKGSTVTIRCKGRGCPFGGTKKVKVRKRAKQLSIVKVLAKRQRSFRKGAKLTVRLSGPKWSPKETIYTMRPKKLPYRTEFCITDRRRAC